MENCDLDSATSMKDRADEYSMKLMEEHKREKEVALARILQLERELDQKHKLEFEIDQLKGKLKVIEHYLQGEEDIYKLIDKIHKKREEEKKGLGEPHDTLLMEHKANQRLSEAHAELIKDYQCKDLLQHTIERVSSASQKAKEKANDLIFPQFLQTNFFVAVERPTSPLFVTELTSSYSNSSSDELFLWPWVGMLVNLPMENDDVSLKEQFSEFNPINVIAFPEGDLVSRKGEAVILFNRDLRGFKDAMAFENHFKLKRMGKKEWYEKKGVNFVGIHGWIAHGDDYNSDKLFAKILRKHGEMRTVVDVMEKVKDNGMAVPALVKKIDVMDKYSRELKHKNNKAVVLLKNIMDSKAKILKEYNEEMHNVKQKGRENARRNLMENGKLKLELGTKKNEIEQCCREVQKYEDKNDSVKRNLDIEKEKVALANNYLELALTEKKRSDEKVKKLMEEHKRAQEVALARVLQLERELDQTQKLDLEIAHLKGKLKVMEDLQGEEDIDKKIEEIHKKMEEDKEAFQELHNTLLMKEREANQELNEARAELIQGLAKLSKGPSLIGVKRMGDLDIKPFASACKKKFLAEDADLKASEFCSSWVEKIRDPSWHPFKIIERDGANEEVIDENDPKLKSLWLDFGDDVYNAVKKALLEMNEYNPSGRYPVADLWNMKEDRKAKLKEVIHYIAKQFKTRRQCKDSLPANFCFNDAFFMFCLSLVSISGEV